jgi:hypothetical protein
MPFPRVSIITGLLAAACLSAQVPAAPDDLFRTIAALDSALFQSYNTCDLEKFTSYFTEDVEFYHDQSGLTTGAKTVAAQVRQNICGKARRELVDGSLEVYPMKGYGAVQIGVHRFYQPPNGTVPVGIAKFVHLWQKKDGAWKITRVISYDHVPLKK